MSHIWLQAIQRQDYLFLFLQSFLQPLLIGQMQRQQFFIPVELIGDRALCHLEPQPSQLLVNLRDTPLLLIPQCPHERDHGLCCKNNDGVVSSASHQDHERSCFHEPAEPVQMAPL